MKKKLPFLIIIALIAIIVTLVSVIIKLSAPKEETNYGVVFAPNEETTQDKQEEEELPGIVIPGWTAIKLPAGTTEAEVSIYNPEANCDFYDLSFTLRLAETEEVLFTTGKIEPGMKCTKVTLKRKLESGEYRAIMNVQPYLKVETESATNNAELEITLIVE